MTDQHPRPREWRGSETGREAILARGEMQNRGRDRDGQNTPGQQPYVGPIHVLVTPNAAAVSGRLNFQIIPSYA
jgi:hypothetical protein